MDGLASALWVGMQVIAAAFIPWPISLCLRGRWPIIHRILFAVAVLGLLLALFIGVIMLVGAAGIAMGAIVLIVVFVLGVAELSYIWKQGRMSSKR